ncbi:MAG: Cupin 2 conserved barrel domain protein, partial [Akkermansiaceae bacterium]|nr:Cupin 2 conserved barrel domain protein [Akkermansiaceae bacterium]
MSDPWISNLASFHPAQDLQGEGSAPCGSPDMNIACLSESVEEFFILQTTSNTQTAVMRLSPGDATSSKKERHPNSDQTVLLIEGELEAELAGEVQKIGPGTSLIVPAGTPHRFVNRGGKLAIAFTVYA